VQLGHGFSLTANYAQTFNPPSISVVTIDYATPPASTSDGYDLGLRYILPGGRLTASLSRYSSTTANNTTTQPPGFSNFNVLLGTTSIANDVVGASTPAAWACCPRRGGRRGQSASRGTELEIVANLTRQWRLTLNYGSADSTQNNTYQNTAPGSRQ